MARRDRKLQKPSGASTLRNGNVGDGFEIGLNGLLSLTRRA